MIGVQVLGIVIAKAIAASRAGTPMDTVRATPVAIVGEDSPGAPVMLGEISGFAFDSKGRLYVTDFKEKRVVVLDQAGRQLATIGRAGQGPGEFEAPTGPAFGRDGSLFVRNMVAVSRFTVDPATGIANRYASSFNAFTYAPWRSKTASLVDADERFAFPRDSNPSGWGASHHSYVRYATSGAVVDTLRVPQHATGVPLTASYMISARSGRMVRGLNAAPFAPLPVWTLTSRGTVISGDGAKYELAETDRAGATVRRYTRAIAPTPVPARDRADSLAALRRRIDSLPVPLDKVLGVSDAVRKQQLPTTLPAYIGVLSAPDGQVWVRRWATQPNTSVFDLFSRNGAYYRTVVVPQTCANEPAPVVGASVFACLVLDADTGAETILLATLPK